MSNTTSNSSKRKRATEVVGLGGVEPHDHDVLSGRGNHVNNHPGNEYFRALVNQYKVKYVKAPKQEKGKFSQMIVEAVKARNPPGRFLKQGGGSAVNSWYDIGDKKAIDKTRQALREGAPEIAKGLKGEPMKRTSVTEAAFAACSEAAPSFAAYPSVVGTVMLPPSNLVTPTHAPKRRRQIDQEELEAANVSLPLESEKVGSQYGGGLSWNEQARRAYTLAQAESAPRQAPPSKFFSPSQYRENVSMVSPTPSLPDSPPPKEEKAPIYRLNDNDVVCWEPGHLGYDIIYGYLPGNIQFCNIIKTVRERASQRTRPTTTRLEMAGQIVNEVRSQSPPGRFLRKGEGDGLWYEVGNVDAIERALKGLDAQAAESKKTAHDSIKTSPADESAKAKSPIQEEANTAGTNALTA